MSTGSWHATSINFFFFLNKLRIRLLAHGFLRSVVKPGHHFLHVYFFMAYFALLFKKGTEKIQNCCKYTAVKRVSVKRKCNNDDNDVLFREMTMFLLTCTTLLSIFCQEVQKRTRILSLAAFSFLLCDWQIPKANILFLTIYTIKNITHLTPPAEVLLCRHC